MKKVKIGIDPDLVKSGVCSIIQKNGKEQIVDVQTVSFFDLLKIIDQTKKLISESVSIVVYIEAGWLNAKSNYHGAINKEIAGRIGKNVGENHAVGKLIEEYCKREQVEYKLVKPTSKKWDAKLFKQITGFTGRSNSEMRDAVRAAWN